MLFSPFPDEREKGNQPEANKPTTLLAGKSAGGGGYMVFHELELFG